jgi:hypothetical protein
MEDRTYTIPTTWTLTDPALAALSGTCTVPLTFTGGESRFTPDLTYPIGANSADELADAFAVLRNSMRLHTTLARRDAHHPHRHGLVPQELPVGHVGMTSVAVDQAALGWYRAGTAVTALIDPLPIELTRPSFGWFAPGVTPETFGALYVAAVSSLDTGAYTADKFPGLGWALVQAGIDGHLAYAAWDDQAGIEKLCSRAVHEDAEITMTMRALTDSTAVGDGLRSHRYRQALMTSRDRFPGRTLRPRLVPDIIDATLATWGLATTRGTGMNTLDDYTIFGWNAKIPAVPAVHAIVLTEGTTAPAHLTFVAALQEALNARTLGTVIVTPGDTQRAWVTRAPNLLSELRAAFRIDDGVRLVTVPAWLTGDLTPIPATLTTPEPAAA